MADNMPLRLPDSAFTRDYEIEQEFGVDNLKLYGYWERENSLDIVGQIFAEKISNEFKLVCTLYDEDGDVLDSVENATYGGVGFVTSMIKPATFFNGFPFRIEAYGTERSKVKEIRIVLSD